MHSSFGLHVAYLGDEPLPCLVMQAIMQSAMVPNRKRFNDRFLTLVHSELDAEAAAMLHPQRVNENIANHWCMQGGASPTNRAFAPKI
jgi:hypothetical protein